MMRFFYKVKVWIYLLFAKRNIFDMRQNIFVVEGVLKGKSRIRISGKNNRIIFRNGKYKNIHIGIDGNDNIIEIGEGVRIGSLKIMIQDSSSMIMIGQNTQIGEAKIVCCEYQDQVLIGKNNLIADDVEFWGCDGHSIYQNGERINCSSAINISDDVWIGRSVRILKGVTLYPNTVVGMGSLVTAREYPRNVLIAGLPAKVIKHNITWGAERT